MSIQNKSRFEGRMKASIAYTIVAVPFHADAATHDELAQKVNEKLSAGYELYGPPFLSEEMMYQPMTKPILPISRSRPHEKKRTHHGLVCGYRRRIS